MAKYKCSVCGFVYDEEKEGRPFSQLQECPVCRQPASAFFLWEEADTRTSEPEKQEISLEYPRECIPQTPTDGFAEQNGRDAERAD